jgi:hypothetical protein
MSDEVMDCSTISITYQVNGLANITMTVYRPKADGPPYSKGGPGFEMLIGGIRFKGFVTEQTLVPATEVDDNEWRVSATAIGCKDNGTLTAC